MPPPGHAEIRPASRFGRPQPPADWRDVARSLGVAYLDRLEPTPRGSDEEPPAPEIFSRAEAIFLGEGPESVLVVAPDATARAAIGDFLARHPGERRRLAVAAPREIRRALIETWQAALTRRAVNAILDRDPRHSAAGSPHPALLLTVALLVAGWVLTLWGAVAPIVAWTAIFLVIGLLRMLVADGTMPPAPPPVPDAALPRCAVLVPIYREAAVVPDLVAALRALDYPGDRLEVRLIVEEDDVETRRAVEIALAETPFDMVVVPPSRPRTKPKALNFALATVAADFVTIYDAEDRPDPDQLRRAAAVFAASPPDLAVVQAALAIDHDEGDRSWLVRQFEIEYAILFRAILPWLAERRLLLPLGGTSNHFRRVALDRIGGWDPHNVTEDADVAVRLVRAGWRAGVVDSATHEEAPARPRAWLAQRTRWMKGWMQTWFAHMRSPLRLHRELGLADAVILHLVLAGQILSAATYVPSLLLIALQASGLHPLFWGATIDADVVAVAALCAFAAGVLGALVVALRVSATAARRFRLGDVMTMPLYWCGLSVAVWAAVVELLAKPHRWNKTEHGRARRRTAGPSKVEAAPADVAGRDAALASCVEPGRDCKRDGLERV